MFHPDTKNRLRECTALELEQAKKEHGESYHSAHEAYAVILEEIQEAQAHLEMLQFPFDSLWKDIRADKTNDDLHDSYGVVAMYAELAAMELCQVSACCKKARGE